MLPLYNSVGYENKLPFTTFGVGNFDALIVRPFLYFHSPFLMLFPQNALVCMPPFPPTSNTRTAIVFPFFLKISFGTT